MAGVDIGVVGFGSAIASVSTVSITKEARACLKMVRVGWIFRARCKSAMWSQGGDRDGDYIIVPCGRRGLDQAMGVLRGQ